MGLLSSSPRSMELGGLPLQNSTTPRPMRACVSSTKISTPASDCSFADSSYPCTESQVHAVARSGEGCFDNARIDEKLTNLIVRQLLSLIVFCLLAGPVWAANCPDGAQPGNGYVRAGAAGTHSGADWTNAFTDLPANLTRGCVYWVATGAYKNHNFGDADSGAVTITVRAATTANHGTATGWSNTFATETGSPAVFSCPSVCEAIFYWFGNGSGDFTIIDGQQRASGPATYTTWTTPNSYPIRLDNTNRNAGNNCGAEACGDLQGGESTNPNAYAHDITVQYIEVSGSHPPRNVSTPSYNTFEEGVVWENGSSNLTFQYNWVHDTGRTDIYMRGTCDSGCGGSPRGGGQGPSTGNVFQYNVFEKNNAETAANPSWPHGEGCSCSEGIQDLTFRYNIFNDNVGTASIATVSGGDYNTTNQFNGPWYIYGNVFMCSDPGSFCGISDGTIQLGDVAFNASGGNGNVYILNNTFTVPVGAAGNGNGLDISNCTVANGCLGSGPDRFTVIANLYLENNLFWNVPGIQNNGNSCMNCNFSAIGYLGFGSNTTNFFSDFNSYFSSTFGGGNDPNAHAQITAGNPFVSSSTFNWMLANDTAAWTNTNAVVAGNALDFVGTARTSSRGAFQFAASMPPNAAASLTAVPH